MNADNLISVNINQKDKEKVEQAVKTLTTLLDKHLVTLSADERKEIPKMGDGTVPFVEKVMEYAKTNPEFAPPYVNMEEQAIDVEGVKTLSTIYRPLVQLMRQLEDSIMLSGSEAYVASLAYYNSVKLATRSSAPGAEPIYKDLKQRFAKNGTSAAQGSAANVE